MSSSNCGDCADSEIYEKNMLARIEQLEKRLSEAEELIAFYAEKQSWAEDREYQSKYLAKDKP